MTVESELRFSIESDTSGQQLFEQVAKNIGIQESWFFGLQYIDSKNVECWLKIDKKVLEHDFPKGAMDPLTFKFRARFYPQEVSEELHQDITQVNFLLPGETSIERFFSLEILLPSIERGDSQRGHLLSIGDVRSARFLRDASEIRRFRERTVPTRLDPQPTRFTSTRDRTVSFIARAMGTKRHQLVARASRHDEVGVLHSPVENEILFVQRRCADGISESRSRSGNVRRDVFRDSEQEENRTFAGRRRTRTEHLRSTRQVKTGS